MPQITLYPASNGSNSQFVEVPNAGFVFGDQFESATFAAWTTTVGTPTIVSSVHSGLHAAQFAATATYLKKTLPSGLATGYFRQYFQVSAVPPVSGNWVRVMQAMTLAGGSLSSVYIWNSSGVQQIRLDYFIPSTVSTYFNYSFAPNTWYCLELKFVSDANNGEYRLYINGAEVKALTGLNTSPGNLGQAWVGQVGSTYTVTMLVDDAAVSTSPVGVENRAALVDSSHNTTALQITQISGMAQQQQETETMQTTTQSVGTISSVEVHMKALASGASDAAETLLVTQSTVYAGSPTSIAQGTLLKSGGASDTTGFSDYSTTYVTNPNTGVAWTWSDINQLQAGAQATTLGASEIIQFSQFYVIVNYVTATLIYGSDTGAGSDFAFGLTASVPASDLGGGVETPGVICFGSLERIRHRIRIGWVNGSNTWV